MLETQDLIRLLGGIRPARPTDGPALAAIYAPIVSDTVISFETVPPGGDEMARRVADTLATHPWLVMTQGGEIAGYAYAGPHRSREAYRWSCDVSVYVAASARRRGVGRALYEALFDILRQQGLVRAHAGIALPNPQSVALHEAMGFAPIGVYRSVGHKFGAWHDVGWWSLGLNAAPADPADPIPFATFASRLAPEA